MVFDLEGPDQEFGRAFVLDLVKIHERTADVVSMDSVEYCQRHLGIKNINRMQFLYRSLTFRSGSVSSNLLQSCSWFPSLSEQKDCLDCG